MIPSFGTKAYFDMCDKARAEREAFYALPESEQLKIIDHALQKLPPEERDPLSLLRKAAQALQKNLKI